MRRDTSKTAPTQSVAGLAASECAHFKVLAKLTPIFDAAFAPFSHVVLAVSGGSDSMAMLHLAVAWSAARKAAPQRQTTPTFSVVTVDHALRVASAAEAASVADAAAQLNLPHTTLVWEAEKPTTSIQATARDARLNLIRAHLSQHCCLAIAMAHTADDQAETLLMRLARGSGVDGLAAMRPATQIGPGQTLLRPLLGICKAELTAYLRSRDLTWTEDPSNQSPQFERVRLRRARTALAAEGIDLESKALARTAARMARASAALAETTRRAWASGGQHAQLSPLGFATVEWEWLLTLPEDIRLRLLAGLLDAIGGQATPMSLGQLERLTISNDWRPFSGTVHGVQLRRSGTCVLLFREVGRSPPAPVHVTPGTNLVWDGRFRLTMPSTLAQPVVLDGLGRRGVSALRTTEVVLPHVPTAVLWTLPALWHPAGALVAVPAIHYAAANVNCFMPHPMTCTLIGPIFATHA